MALLVQLQRKTELNYRPGLDETAICGNCAHLTEAYEFKGIDEKRCSIMCPDIFST